MNFKEIIENCKKGNITVNKHPYFGLYIFNYTEKASRKAIWNESTLGCRGLIINKKGDIVTLPFRKFFEIEQINNSKVIPKEKPTRIYEKLDGSLGILYWWNDKPYITTRGNFTSYQAIKATEILYDKYYLEFNKLNKKYTYLFEIIIPECRVVIDYGETRDLYLIGVIDKQTQRNLRVEDFSYLKFPTPQLHLELDNFSFKELSELNYYNREGLVLVYENGFRLKIKFEGYKKKYKYYTYHLKKLAFDIVFNDVEQKSLDNFEDLNYLNALIRKILETQKQLLEESTSEQKVTVWKKLISNQFFIHESSIDECFKQNN